MDLVKWLGEGDLRSDGAANEVARFVVGNPAAVRELIAALGADADVVRGHGADALEKVARQLPAAIEPHLDQIMAILQSDEVPMVRWHLAMVLGHLAFYEQRQPAIFVALAAAHRDKSVFVASWVMTSLCVLALLAPTYEEQVAQLIVPFRQHPSTALRTRARKALRVLTDPQVGIPPGWIKSDHIRARLTRGGLTAKTTTGDNIAP